MNVLRPYQQRAIDQLRDAVRAGHRRIVLVSPTGSGKTEMGFEIIRGAIANGKRIGFIAHRIQLIDQTSRRLQRAALDHGIVQGANSRREYMPLLACSIQTLAKRKELAENIGTFDVLVIDEAHTSAKSKAYRELMARHKDKIIIGLTATPFAKGMGAHAPELEGPLWQELVIAAHYEELISGGYLVDCDVYAPTEPDMSAFKLKRNAAGELDYSDEDAGKAMSADKLVGDVVEHWQRLANGKPTVCFASTIAHSKKLIERFSAAGVRAEHIDCYTNDEDRRGVLKRIESGETTIISNVGILTEGWDFPACEVLILARPTRSITRFMQMGGRVLRPSPGKERALIIDHSGTCVRLGFPTDDREYVLDDGKAKDSGTSDDQEEPKHKACPQCGHMDPLKRNPCPKCGHERVHPKRDEISEGEGELKKLERKEKFSMQTKQQWYSGLLSICRNKGYKEGWVARKYRDKFGVWPKGVEHYAIEPTPEVRSWVLSQQIRFAKSQERNRG